MNSFTDYKHLAREFYSGKTFIALDTETTGLKASVDYVLEIGAVKFNCDGIIGDPFDILIKPPIPVLPFITNLTGITNEMLKDKGPAGKAMQDFIRFIETDKAYLVAHNAPFDIGFIFSELERNSLPQFKNKVIDTLPLSRWAYPTINETEKGQYKLQSLAQRFNINVQAAHRAYDDARVCMEIFKQIIKDTMSQQKDYQIHSEKNLLTSGSQQLSLF